MIEPLVDAHMSDEQFVAAVLARWARFKETGIPEDLSGEERATILMDIDEARSKVIARKGILDGQMADRNLSMSGRRVGSHSYHTWRAEAVKEITALCSTLGHLKIFRTAMNEMGGSPQRLAADRSSAGKQAWEYVIVDGADELIEETLNEMGALGWELCAALAGAKLFLKRGYDA